MMRWLRVPFYPLPLIALFPIHFFAANLGFFDGYAAARLTLLATAATLVALAGLRLVLRSADLAAALTAAGIIAALAIGPDRVLLGIFAVAAGLILYAVRRLRLVRDATVIANVICLSLLIQPVATIASGTGLMAWAAERPIRFGPIPGLASAARERNAVYPSVVHIVLDGYSGSGALKRIYGFDNADFSGALAEKGFQVFGDVSVPYNQTLLSVSAVMNGDYPPFEFLGAGEASAGRVRAMLSKFATDGAVVKAMRENGHEITFTRSTYNEFKFDNTARPIGEKYSLFDVDIFDVYFARKYLFPLDVRIFTSLASFITLDQLVKEALAEEVVDVLRPPFFLFSHVLAPHPPFTMDRNGAPTNRWAFSLMGDGDHAHAGEPALMDQYREGYVEKLRFTNKAVLQQVSRMIDDLRVPLVIIIQGDHGGGSLLFHEEPERSCLMERMQTTVAVYSNVPEVSAAFRQHGLTNTVNLYRILFAALAGTEPVLAEGQFFARWSDPAHPVSLAGMDFNRNCD